MKKIKVRGKNLWCRFKDKLPHMTVCFSKFKGKPKLGKAAFVLVPLILGGAGVAVGVTLLNRDDKPVTNVETGKDKSNRRIYLASRDNLTVPLTVALEKRGTKGEELKEIFNLLKTDSKANTNSIKGIVPKETKLNSLELFNDELVIDVSSEFLEYEKSQEINLLESLVYTFSEYPDINMLSLYVDGTPLTKMPKGNTSVPDFLSKGFGINRGHKSAEDVAGKNMINVYYTKTYDAVSYLIPVSQYVESSDSIAVQLVNAAGQKVDDEKGLTLASAYGYLEKTQSAESSDKVKLQVKATAMKEEGVIKKDIFDIVSLTLGDLGEKQEVSFYVEDEEMMVEGLVDTSDFEVSDVIYNQVEI